MDIGFGVMGLGVLGILIGAAFCFEDYRKTIGLGGMGIGVVLLVFGPWMSRSRPKAGLPHPTQTNTIS